ncbi:MAG TPA: YncE family protein [Burkholderiaceae bacterium]|nr:YncE family protein [Burkholderiaceae bacterium]
MDVSDDLIVSANDAKQVRTAGVDSFPAGVGADTLTLIDAAVRPPRVLATIEVATSIVGPPQAVAIAPDGALAVVSATNRYDAARRELVFENHLQVVDVRSRPPVVTAKIDVGHHPQGLAFNRTGTLLLAATNGGTVAVLAVEGARMRLVDRLLVSSGRLAGVSFTPDGRSALVAQRDEQGVAVLEVDGSNVVDSGERVSTGVAPYALDVDAQGKWAVVGNVGLAGLGGGAATRKGVLVGDADSFTLIDISRRPFRAVQHATVPSIPEGVAISPDGRWIVALCMDGSNLPAGNPARRERGRLQLFRIVDDHAERVSDLPAGESAQGVVFTADSRFVLAQFYVERRIALFDVNGGALVDTGTRIVVPGGPASLRAMPR